jgi:cell fate regulator YaaT (PSP1 superfamily)
VAWLASLDFKIGFHMLEIVTVKFPYDNRRGEFLAHDLQLRVGDRCIVTTDRGVELGVVVDGRRASNLAEQKSHRALRKATERDLYLNEKKRDKEEFAYRLCKKQIKVRNLPIKLSSVECVFDGSRIIFYFTADHRVDFRELVKDLARVLRTRIEMRQIGARDEAKIVGGLGSCALGENCSKLFLNELESVSVRTVKEQGLGMNLNRLSGMCGRLKCCLNFGLRCDEDCGQKPDASCKQ